MIEITWGVRPEEAPLEDADVAAAARAALHHGGRDGVGLSVVFVDDATLARMHAEHLADPTETDVITFDLGEEGEGPVGELYVSVERAIRIAARRGVPAARELALYVVHGVLHLCGWDDRDEGQRARMRAAESKVLTALGYDADPNAHDFGVE